MKWLFQRSLFTGRHTYWWKIKIKINVFKCIMKRNGATKWKYKNKNKNAHTGYRATHFMHAQKYIFILNPATAIFISFYLQNVCVHGLLYRYLCNDTLPYGNQMKKKKKKMSSRDAMWTSLFNRWSSFQQSWRDHFFFLMRCVCFCFFFLFFSFIYLLLSLCYAKVKHLSLACLFVWMMQNHINLI